MPAQGFAVEGQGATTLRLDPGALASGQTTAVVAGNAPITVPYFTLSASGAEYYDWSAAPPAVRGEPFGPPELTASFLIDSAATVTREVALRVNDQARGEIRRPVAVVPRVNVAIDPATAVWPAGDPRAAPVHRHADARRAAIRPTAPRRSRCRPAGPR